MASDFRPRDTHIFRPYPDEIPWELLSEGDPDEALSAADVDADFVRVARHAGQVVGAYVLQQQAATVFVLENLVVSRSYRSKGLGSWLLGHAIGLAETKGARHILVPGVRPRRLFTRVGFVQDGDGLRLDLTPE
jgi:predicted N-acetyltransferase YhbS